MALQQIFSIETLWQEAHTRWLKPAEVLFILQNYERLELTHEPPNRPPSGSLFLFNRRILRFFRKDGYMWRKKKDGRTVGEAHERLKVGNVDALNCYYAHGEQNPYFQRRVFWMLDPAHDNIVLVHYREVAEGRYISGTISSLSNESPSTFNPSASITNAHQVQTAGTGELYQSSFSPSSVEEVSSKFVLENFEAKRGGISDRLDILGQSTQPEVNKAIRKLAEQLSLGDDVDDLYFEDNPIDYSVENGSSHLFDTLTNEQSEFYREPPERLQSVELRGHGEVIGPSKEISYRNTEIALVTGNYGSCQSQPLLYDHGIERNDSASWTDMLNLSSSSAGTVPHGRTILASDGILETPKVPHHLLSSSQWVEDSPYPFEQQENLPWYKAEDRSKYHASSANDLQKQLSATRRFLLGSETSFDSPTSTSLLNEVQEKHLSGKKASESNIRKENNSDWIGSLPMSVGNTSYLPDLSSTWFDKNQFETPAGIGSSLTLSQKQQFSIREISPEWAFTNENTKVIITGDFLCNPKECTWSVMFGDTEVPVEIVQEGVLRCQTPSCTAGKVTLCITRGNRESCSEIRDFEFRSNPNASNCLDNKAIVDTAKSEQLLLLSKLVQLLLCDHDSSVVLKGINESDAGDYSKLKTTNNSLQQVIEVLSSNECNNPIDIMDLILQELLKDKFQHWLSSKLKHSKTTGCLLTKQEQGIIHLISGLGYEWALAPILDAGVGINFRDAHGWTALHWAAHCGREKMVAALLAAEASAGLVTDPTPQDPVGKTPAFLASARGHKGLAGYLSEVALTSHLSSLTMEENEISKGSAEMEAERAVENVSQRSVEVRGGTEDELSLKDSLAAVRNVAQAAARIQSAFRAHSFRKRQQKLALSRDEYGMTQGDIQGLSAASRSYGKLDKAAVSIQKKYRGWKGRRDFLALRQHVVKIQAHVRGHQVRKKYREFIWTVSIVEKVILRWRRKGVGLRGFKAEPDMIEEDEEEEEDIAKVFRKQKVDDAIDEAVSRVLSMVDSPEARQQYRRMLERYRQAKAELGSSDEATSKLQGDISALNDDFMY